MWELLRGATACNGFKTGERFVVEQRRVDAVELRQISGKFLQPFAELTLGAGWVRLLVMIEADGQMNHALEE